MIDEAKQDIAEDTMRDDGTLIKSDCECEVCVLSRLCDRQSAMIKAQDKSRAIKDQMIAFLEAQVADLKDKLEEERGRNRVLGFQIRTLREGK